MEKHKNTKNNNVVLGKSFLQSIEWEEFQKSLGRKTFRIKGRLFIKMPLTLGQSYLYCPRSVCRQKDLEIYLDKVKVIAGDEKAFFVRFEPIFIEEGVDLKEFGARKVTSRQPSETLRINLQKSVEEILKTMKQKTRYNIRLAEKRGVKIKKSTSVSDIDIFYKIAKETAKRDKIKIYSKEYYKKMAKVFLDSGKFAIYIAKYNDKAISCNLMLYYDKVAYYLHGASSGQNRSVMAPHLLQWEAIKDAKKKGAKWYDFWGTAPLEVKNEKFKVKNEKHPWYGITKFKLGFVPTSAAGKYIEYPGCYEISYGKKRYLLYSMFKRVM